MVWDCASGQKVVRLLFIELNWIKAKFITLETSIYSTNSFAYVVHHIKMAGNETKFERNM